MVSLEAERAGGDQVETTPPADERLRELSATAARNAEQARLLVAIASQDHVEDDVRGVLQEALTGLAKLVAFTGASVALVEGDELVVRAAVGPFAEPALTQRVPRGQALVWRVLETGEPFVADDLAAEGLLSASGDPLRAYIAVPLSRRGRRIGVLEVDSTEPGAFGESDVALVQGVAAVLSGSVELAARAQAELALRHELAAAVDAERKARAEAEEALATRDQFLSIASHELKTPLTPIKAGAQLLQRAVQQPEVDRARVLRQLRAIDSQVDRLRMLVDDLLDTARIQSGRLELRPESVDLVDVVAKAVSTWEEAQRPRIVLEASCPLPCELDPFRTEQVVVNLIDNALKYSPQTERVDVRLSAEDGRAVLRVVDRGIGVPEGARRTIFQPFSRGANASVRHYGGLGLGLFISRTLVERHGGTLELATEVGQGSTFTVSLPLTSTPAAPASPRGT